MSCCQKTKREPSRLVSDRMRFCANRGVFAERTTSGRNLRKRGPAFAPYSCSCRNRIHGEYLANSLEERPLQLEGLRRGRRRRLLSPSERSRSAGEGHPFRGAQAPGSTEPGTDARRSRERQLGGHGRRMRLHAGPCNRSRSDSCHSCQSCRPSQASRLQIAQPRCFIERTLKLPRLLRTPAAAAAGEAPSCGQGWCKFGVRFPKLRRRASAT
jgi:hypothetical protein